MRAPAYVAMLLSIVAGATAACGGDADQPAAQPTAGAAGGAATGGAGGSGLATEGGYDDTPIGGARPTKVYVPSTYRKGTPAPVVVLLHGYGVSGLLQNIYFDLEPLAESRGFLLVHPDGVPDATNKRYWNASDECCNFEKSTVDDSGYLIGLVDEIATRWSVDPKRVYFMGHSNGAFMSYRMACDHAGRIAAIASLAGAMFSDVTKCKASEPVAVLQIHGTKDDTIPYEGGTLMTGHFPGAETTVADWAAIDGCSTGLTSVPPLLDDETSIPGAETEVLRYGACKPGGAVELWRMEGAGHIPALQRAVPEKIIDFLLAHPKP